MRSPLSRLLVTDLIVLTFLLSSLAPQNLQAAAKQPTVAQPTAAQPKLTPQEIQQKKEEELKQQAKMAQQTKELSLLSELSNPPQLLTYFVATQVFTDYIHLKDKKLNRSWNSVYFRYHEVLPLDLQTRWIENLLVKWGSAAEKGDLSTRELLYEILFKDKSTSSEEQIFYQVLLGAAESNESLQFIEGSLLGKSNQAFEQAMQAESDASVQQKYLKIIRATREFLVEKGEFDEAATHILHPFLYVQDPEVRTEATQALQVLLLKPNNEFIRQLFNPVYYIGVAGVVALNKVFPFFKKTQAVFKGEKVLARKSEQILNYKTIGTSVAVHGAVAMGLAMKGYRDSISNPDNFDKNLDLKPERLEELSQTLQKKDKKEVSVSSSQIVSLSALAEKALRILKSKKFSQLENIEWYRDLFLMSEHGFVKSGFITIPPFKEITEPTTLINIETLKKVRTQVRNYISRRGLKAIDEALFKDVGLLIEPYMKHSPSFEFLTQSVSQLNASCVAQTLFLLTTVYPEIQAYIPKHMILGVQVYANHIQPVAHNNETNQTYSMISGNIVKDEFETRIYHPEILLANFVVRYAHEIKNPKKAGLEGFRISYKDYTVVEHKNFVAIQDDSRANLSTVEGIAGLMGLNKSPMITTLFADRKLLPQSQTQGGTSSEKNKDQSQGTSQTDNKDSKNKAQGERTEAKSKNQGGEDQSDKSGGENISEENTQKSGGESSDKSTKASGSHAEESKPSKNTSQSNSSSRDNKSSLSESDKSARESSAAVNKFFEKNNQMNERAEQVLRQQQALEKMKAKALEKAEAQEQAQKQAPGQNKAQGKTGQTTDQRNPKDKPVTQGQKPQSGESSQEVSERESAEISKSRAMRSAKKPESKFVDPENEPVAFEKEGRECFVYTNTDCISFLLSPGSVSVNRFVSSITGQSYFTHQLGYQDELKQITSMDGAVDLVVRRMNDLFSLTAGSEMSHSEKLQLYSWLEYYNHMYNSIIDENENPEHVNSRFFRKVWDRVFSLGISQKADEHFKAIRDNFGDKVRDLKGGDLKKWVEGMNSDYKTAAGQKKVRQELYAFAKEKEILQGQAFHNERSRSYLKLFQSLVDRSEYQIGSAKISEGTDPDDKSKLEVEKFDREAVKAYKPVLTTTQENKNFKMQVYLVNPEDLAAYWASKKVILPLRKNLYYAFRFAGLLDKKGRTPTIEETSKIIKDEFDSEFENFYKDNAVDKELMSNLSDTFTKNSVKEFEPCVEFLEKIVKNETSHEDNPKLFNFCYPMMQTYKYALSKRYREFGLRDYDEFIEPLAQNLKFEKESKPMLEK